MAKRQRLMKEHASNKSCPHNCRIVHFVQGPSESEWCRNLEHQGSRGIVHFVQGPSDSEWCRNLEHQGSCRRLMELLEEKRFLLKQTGRGRTTVLHKAVRHGCNDLIKKVLEMFDGTGKSVHQDITFTVEDLLSEPNCHGATVVMIAAMLGTRDVVMSFKEVIGKMLTRRLHPAGSDQAADSTEDYECRIDYTGICEVEDARVDCIHTLQTETISGRTGNLSGHSRSLEPLKSDRNSSINHIEGSYSRERDPENIIGRSNGPTSRSQTSDTVEISSSLVENTISDFVSLCQFIKKEIIDKADTIRDFISDCEANSNFNFVPIEGIFFHFLCSLNSKEHPNVLSVVCNDIIKKVSKYNNELLKTLFQHRDPRGRTPLHVVVDNHSSENLKKFLSLIPTTVYRECVNARDDAGRTPLHRACIASSKSVIKALLKHGSIDLNARVSPPHYEELSTILNWRCQEYNDTYEEDEHCTALHLAVLHDNSDAVSALLNFDTHKFKETPLDVNAFIKRGFYRSGGLGRTPPNILRRKVNWNGGFWGTPMQLAARLGHTNILEMLLKQSEGHDLDMLKSSSLISNELVAHDDMTPQDYPDNVISEKSCAINPNKPEKPQLAFIYHDKRSMDQGKLGMFKAGKKKFGDQGKSDMSKEDKGNLGEEGKLEKSNSPYDMSLPALHWAARAGEAETVQSLLRNKKYDPLIRDRFHRTALHVAVTMSFMEFDLLCIPDLLPYGSKGNLRRALKKQTMSVQPRDYTGDETVCIGLLLQQGIDIWKRDSFEEIASPGPNASKEAIKWWFNTVNEKVNDYKTNYVLAATNSTSVVATLVATASFIGPLQPPLGYDGQDGYVNAGGLAIQMYLVCNGLSFYLSMTTILVAITFGFPKPNDSTESGMRRSRRILRLIVKLLVVSLLSLILSFAAASVAIIPSEWKERKLVLISHACWRGGISASLLLFLLCALPGKNALVSF